MWFSNKKVKAAQRVLYFAGIVEETQQEIAQAEKITDAGERYLALADVEDKIQQQIEDVTNTLARAKSHGNLENMSSAVATGTILSGIILVAANPFFILLIPVGGAAGVLPEVMKRQSIKKAQAEADEYFIEPMNVLLDKIADRREIMLRDELAGMASSAHFDTLFDNFPAVRDAFTKASIKESLRSPIIRLDKPFPPQTPKP